MSYLIFIICLVLFIALSVLSICLTYKLENLENELFETKKDLNRERARNVMYQKDMIVLLDNSQELRNKITDLENNLEVVVNSLPANIKELARPDNQH